MLRVAQAVVWVLAQGRRKVDATWVCSCLFLQQCPFLFSVATKSGICNLPAEYP